MGARRSRGPRSVLLQLPVQSHDYSYSRENLPLAPALVAAWARREHPDLAIDLAPPRVTDELGDDGLLQWLESTSCDLVGLGCSVWNLERSLYLAREIKRQRPSTFVVLGGPEISLDNGCLKGERAGFDAAVVGEGERTFSELLSALAAGSELARVPGLLLSESWALTEARDPIEPLDAIPSPVLSGLYGPTRSGSVFLETVRGCPQRCAYCHYHKDFPRMRRFELARIEAELRRCLELGAREVTFVDPCFARRPGLEELLELLRRLGRGRLAVRCELNAEDVTLAKAEALARAGVREVEIGLQTTNPRALRLAQRPFHERRFLEGVRALRGEGVRVLLDVMVGLPGDALEDVKRSVEFAVSRKLFDDLKVYPLCVLPGTVFRRRAGELGLVHQSAPPYHILQGAQMSPRDIYDALSFAEQACGEDLFPIDVPGPLRNTSVVRGATIDPGCDLAPLPGDRLGQALRIDVRDPSWTRRLPEIRRAFGPALAKNPYTLLSWFLPARPFPDRRLVARLERLFPRASHTLDRDWFATHHPQRSLQTFVTFPRTARVRLPSDLLETPVSDSQRACAVHFVRDVSESTEAKFVDELAQHLDPDVWFRISAPS